MALPNGIRSNYQYDNLNRLTSLSHIKLSNQSVVSSYAYTLLADGRRGSVTEVYNGTTTQVNYTYDNLNRLTGESRQVGMGSPTATTYTYDLVGNRVKKHDGTYETTYTYNNRDELTLEESTDSDPLKEIAYTYDTNGSLITTDYANDSVDEDEFTYDVEQRLIAATLKRTEDSQSVEITTAYRYNHQGIRVKADQTAITVASVAGTPVQRRYLIDPFNHTGYAQVLEERDSSNAPRTTYTIGHDVLSQASPSGGPSGGLGQHLLYDGHGTTRHLTNSSATVVESYNYDAYGNMISATYGATNQPQTNHLYTGEQYDTDLRMTYLRARYYDQSNGRFNRLDPSSGNRYDPVSLHKYAYAHADPITNIDPLGLFSIPEVLTSATTQVLNYMNIVSRIIQAKNYIETFISVLQLLYELSQGNITEIIRSVYEEFKTELAKNPDGNQKIRNITIDDLFDIVRRIVADIPEIAGILFRHKDHRRRIAQAAAESRKSGTDERFVFIAPTAGGFYAGDEWRTVRLPGVKVAGLNAVMSVTSWGGRLFGFGFKKKNARSGYQIFRVDWHDSPKRHNLAYSNYFTIRNGMEIHWTIPETASDAKTRYRQP